MSEAYRRLALWATKRYMASAGGAMTDTRLLVICLMFVIDWAESRDIDFRVAVMTAERIRRQAADA